MPVSSILGAKGLRKQRVANAFHRGLAKPQARPIDPTSIWLT
jgi:hypothetical protein